LSETLSILVERVRPLYEGKDPAHRFDHIERIIDFCLRVGPPLGADMGLLLPAALVHGVKEDERLREVLGERYKEVVNLARNASKSPQTLEERVLHDANLYDALGAIGIARAFTKGGYEGQTIEETLRIMKENIRRPLLTQEGRRMAEERLEFMRRFLERLEEEMRVLRTVSGRPPSP